MKELFVFDTHPNQDKVTVQSSIEKNLSILLVKFVVDDPEGLILLHKKDNIFQRSHELWASTCFECFFSEKNKKSYWEINLDHCGNWNIYFFDDYRSPHPPQEEKRVQQLELEFLRKQSGFELECKLDLNDLGLEHSALDASLNCVVEWKDGGKSYYALKHRAQKPDFHLRETFICSLE